MEVQRDPSGHSSFVAGPRPACGFSFSGPSSPRAGLMRTRLKRPRPRTDVDGERSGESGKKKRRLRLFLITSRLSPPFSTPPTYIVGRGSSKIAIWAKQKALGRNLLRKAAILNHVRMRAAKVQEANSGQMERTRRSFMCVFGCLGSSRWRSKPTDSLVANGSSPLRGYRIDNKSLYPLRHWVSRTMMPSI